MDENQDDPDLYTRGDLAFHSALAAATHNELFGILFDPISELLADMIRVSLGASEAAAQGLAHHRNVLEQIKRGEPQASRDAMQDHLARAVGLVEAARDRARSVEKESKQ
jgi:DNA-binding FadR family transcriptional regulator